MLQRQLRTPQRIRCGIYVNKCSAIVFFAWKELSWLEERVLDAAKDEPFIAVFLSKIVVRTCSI